MPFKINISEKNGKTYHLETESGALVEKELHDKVEGKDVSPDLEGYEFEIVGASDNAGFTAMANVEGIGLKKVLLSYGKGMHMKPKGEKKKGSKPKGLRMRKTVRGRIISKAIIQINLKVLKEGSKKLQEIFPEQNKSKEPEKPAESENKEPTEVKSEEKAESAQPEKEPKESEKRIEEATQPEKEPK